METSVAQVMKKYYGYEHFKPGQEEVINSILQAHDTLAIMPTGGGKSLCYQVPAMVLPGITLVISPLIALMKDQVDALNNQGIAASYINSSLTKSAVTNRLKQAAEGTIKLLYVAPERLESEYFTELLRELPLSLVAIDEAHCISQWGHDFRPSYFHIGSWIASLPTKPRLAAFTATATPKVQQDITLRLKFFQPHVFLNSFDRANLSFLVVKTLDRGRYISRYLKEHPEQSGIVYAATRKEVDNLYEQLTSEGIQVGKYHAGLSNNDRSAIQEAFQYDQIQVIVATNAFGLGIDKSNLRFVIHHNMPRHLEAYYQEAGRAGRDDQAADCILLFQASDIQIQKYLIEQSALLEERKVIEYAKLQIMIDYCHTSRCLRGYMLDYFGETGNSENCGNCGNCTDYEIRDITVEAQKIFSCIYRMNQQYGSTMVASVLKGSKQKKVMEFGFNKLSTYGIMKEFKADQIMDMISLLAAEGYLAVTGGKYPVLKLESQTKAVLRGQEKVIVRLPQAPKAASKESTLFQALRELRMQIALEQKVPPYVVFPDTTLREMCASLPLDRESMLGVSGVGEVKYAKYGEQFIAVISHYLKNSKEGEQQ